MGEQLVVGRPRDPRLDAAIIDATVSLLESRGYNGLSLAAVAERAGTTTAAIYRRFGSKSELVARAVFRTDGERMIRWSVEKLSRPAALAAIAGLLGSPKPSRVERAADAAGASMLVIERFERAKERGELRADVDTRVLAAMIDGPVLHAVLGGMASPIDDAWIAGLVRLVLEGAAPHTPVTRTSASRSSRTHTRSTTTRSGKVTTR
ncbi:MAG: TetR/AcrR family transcriptional regulator [Actinobacteria bacterium]|nr:TetR/AcrR family transcriptional regulator [Actinomycetota bacterium]